MSGILRFYLHTGSIDCNCRHVPSHMAGRTYPARAGPETRKSRLAAVFKTSCTQIVQIRSNRGQSMQCKWKTEYTLHNKRLFEPIVIVQ